MRAVCDNCLTNLHCININTLFNLSILIFFKTFCIVGLPNSVRPTTCSGGAGRRGIPSGGQSVGLLQLSRQSDVSSCAGEPTAQRSTDCSVRMGMIGRRFPLSLNASDPQFAIGSLILPQNRLGVAVLAGRRETWVALLLVREQVKERRRGEDACVLLSNP